MKMDIIKRQPTKPEPLKIVCIRCGVMAYVWMNVAAANGLGSAKKSRDKALARLNASERRLESVGWPSS